MQKYVTLVADIMFANGFPFLVTSSRGIGLETKEFFTIKNCEALNTHCRTSAESLCKRNIHCPNNDDGHMEFEM